MGCAEIPTSSRNTGQSHFILFLYWVASKKLGKNMITFPSDCSIISLRTFVIISFVWGLSLSFEKRAGTETAIVRRFSFGKVIPKDNSRVSRVIPSVAFMVSKGASVADIRIAE